MKQKFLITIANGHTGLPATNSIRILNFLTVLPIGLFVVVVGTSVELTINLIPPFAVQLIILQHLYSLTYLKTNQLG